jgi:uncharacterized integral membrane protein (TIGR02327 family)
MIDAVSFDGIVLLQILISLASVYVCWWALQGLRFEKIVHEPGSRQAKLLHLIMAVILGHHFSAFLFTYFGWSIFVR